MKLTYGNQTIDFLDFELPKVAVLSLSGGLDSAALFYLTCKFAPQIEIVPVTCIDLNGPLDGLSAIYIVQWMKENFPHVKIHKHEQHQFNDKTEDFVTYQQVDFSRKTNSRYLGLNRRQMSKILQVDKINYSVLAKWPDAIRFDGMTSNPPIEEMKSFSMEMYEKSEDRRSHDDTKNLNDVLYQPFVNVNKKFVAGIYQEHDLMDSLYTLTGSCVGTSKETNRFRHVCGKCFWCYEKRWAFNL